MWPGLEMIGEGAEGETGVSPKEEIRPFVTATYAEGRVVVPVKSVMSVMVKFLVGESLRSTLFPLSFAVTAFIFDQSSIMYLD